MSSDNEVSQLHSPVRYDTDTFFFQELARDGPPPGGGGGGQGGGGMDRAGLGWVSACAKGGDPRPVCPYLTGSTGYPPLVVWSHSRPDC